MVVGFLAKILPVVAVGIGVFFLANTITRPAAAQETATAIGETGAAFGSTLSDVGQGIGDFFTGVGSGGAKLLDPFFSLKTLIFEEDSNASNTNRSLPNPITPSEAGSYGAGAGPSSEGTSSQGVVSASNSWSSAAKSVTGTSFSSTGGGGWGF